EEKQEAYFTGKPKGGWSMGSPLRAHGSALIAFSGGTGKRSLADMGGKLLSGLLKRRRGGMWGNTQENVFGIMGVHAIAGKADGEAPDIALTLQGKEIREAEMEAMSERARRYRAAGSLLGMSAGEAATREVTLKNNGGSPIFLTVRANYEVPLNKENRRARSEGFSISRAYETMEGKSLEGKVIPLGSLVRVRVRVKTGSDFHYVAIDDKLPAGLEPLNSSLATTQRVGRGSFDALTQRSLSVLSYSEVRDSRVAFYVDEMLAGEYEYTYVARATTPGRFLRPAGMVEAMYLPQKCGTTTIDEVTVR
ncbi:MAG: hypothetical protein GY765_44105, partial [bacterium]|nr:hypothetical protein [bacterium]